MKLRTQVNAWLATAAVLLPLVFGVVVLTMRDVDTQMADMAQAEELIASADQLRQIAVETALFHEDRSATQWQHKMAAMRQELARYRADTPAEVAAIARIEQKFETAQTVYARLSRDAVAGTDTPRPPPSDAQTSLEARSVASLLVITSEISDVGHDLIVDARAQVAQAAQRIKLAITALATALVLLLIFVSRLLRRSVLQPLGSLEGGTRRIAAGDYAQRLNLPQRDEIGQLADAFDAMTGHLQQAQQEQLSLNIHLAESQAAQQTSARALAAERQSLADIIEGTGVGTWQWDLGTGALVLNERWAEIVGHTLAELGSTTIATWLARTHADDLAPSQAHIESHLRGETAALDSEARVRHKDGHWVWVMTRGKVIGRDEDGRPLTLAGTHTDVSAGKRSEALLQQALDRFNIAADSANVGVWEYDIATGTLTWDERMYRLYGRERSATLEPYSLWTSCLHPEDRGHAEAALDECLAGTRDFDPEFRIFWPDGEVRHIRGNAKVIRDQAGTALRMTGTNIDITKLKRGELELRAAMLAADQASAAKSQFLANMSHEIRTPMNAILGMLALLRRTELNTRQAGYTSKTEGAARSLLRLLDDILDFSKVEAGKMTLNPQPFSVDQLLRDLGVLLSANVGAKPVELLFDIDTAVPRRLVGDAMRLQQVLVNLGGNAVKFTPEGAVVLSLRVLQRQADAVTLRVAVRDSGIGIAPENQARIFSGFTQAEASTTRRFGGTGLGVAISQRLVGLMGGELTVDSALGQGSTFHFELTLPVAEDSEPPAELPAELQSGLCVLVVDDNPAALELQGHMVESLGWQVERAASGDEALARLAACRAAGGRCDVVLMDSQMPGLDGWETARRLRQGGLDESALVLMMVTVNDLMTLEQRCFDQQTECVAHLVKPVTASMLLDAVLDARQPREVPRLSTPPVSTGGTQRLTGLRLLLTEDNLNNQEVARELLEDEGATVQIANNGLESVQAVAVADPPFDVVLMDLQMPVMDGFAAAARIRQHLGRTELPIVAMTANVMASDREACLAAGMNEHIGKPFDIEHLVTLLRRLTGRAALALPEAGTAAAWVSATSTLAQRRAPAHALPHALPHALQAAATAAGVELAIALQRMGGKQAVYARVLRTALRDFASMAQALQQPMADADVADAARALHMLKGLAATLGITGLAQAAGAAEKAVSAGLPAAEAMPACAAVGVALAAAVPALAGLAEQLGHVGHVGHETRSDRALAAADAAGGLPGGTAALHQQLAELATLLAQSDMRATELTPALRRQAGNRLGPLWDQLDDAVGALDFEGATSLCRQLLQETP